MNKFLFFLFIFFIANKALCTPLSDFIPEGKIDKPFVNSNYNYLDTNKIPLVFNVQEKISTKDKSLFEGKQIKLVSAETVLYKKQVIIKRGDIINAKIKYIIKSGLNGIPYSIVLDDFEIPNISKAQLKSEYKKDGFNRTYFVLPLKWSLTFLPPTGSFTNFIKGGHAVISPRDDITIYYYPNWAKSPQM